MLTAVVTKMRSPQTIGLAVDPRNRSFPLDVLSGRDVPLGERSLAVTATGGVLAAERGPVSRGGAGRRIETDGRRARGCRGEALRGCTIGKAHARRHRPGSVTVTDSTNPPRPLNAMVKPSISRPERCLACRGKQWAVDRHRRPADRRECRWLRLLPLPRSDTARHTAEARPGRAYRRRRVRRQRVQRRLDRRRQIGALLAFRDREC